jgi:hypothetical protein
MCQCLNDRHILRFRFEVGLGGNEPDQLETFIAYIHIGTSRRGGD